MALIFDIKRFAINDGPGIRTTVFMKGCPLHCVWCHNPEGIASHPTKLYNRKKCIGCSSCVDACPNGVLSLTAEGIVEGGGCTLCGQCVEACPSKAMEMAGREWAMDELMAVIEKERQVMTESGGGVTICGGEPLMHPEELIKMLDFIGEIGFHRTVDTTLHASRETVEQVMKLCELLLIDLKLMDSHLHEQYTGVPNETIIENIRLVSQAAHPYWIRIPLISGVNADEENLEASARFIASLPNPPEVVNLLLYHDIGMGKHARMRTVYNPHNLTMLPPTEEEQQRALSIFAAHGLPARIGG